MSSSTDFIYIDNEALDFEGNYSLSFSANDFLNWQPGTAYKSERLQIYNTSKNRRLLENVFHLNSAGGSSFDAVYVSPLITMTGVLKILSVDRRKAEAVFISGNGSLWEDLKGVKLNEVDCSEYNHTLNYTNVTNSETYSESNFYLYDFCNRGTLIDSTAVDIIERFPAVSLKLLLAKIFAGYTLAGDILSETWFKRLFLLFTMPFEIRNSKEWKTTSLIHVESDTGLVNLTISGGDGSGTFTKAETQISFVETGTGNFDNGGNFASDTYTAPETGTYKFTLDLAAIFDFDAGADSYGGHAYFRIKKNLTEICEFDYTIPDQPASTATATITTGFIELTAGDTIKCYYEVAGTFTGTLTTATINISSATTLENSVSRWYGSGSMVDFAYILPDVEVTSFLNDLFIYFGIYPVYNIEERMITFFRLKSDATTVNFTDKVESKTGVSFETPEPVNYYLKFAEDGNDKQFPVSVGLGEITDGNYEYNIGELDTKEIRLRHLCNTLTDTMSVNSVYTTFEVPKLYNDLKSVSFSTKFGLRLLYFSGVESFTYTLNHGAESGVTSHAMSTAPVLTMVDSSASVNLAFSGTNGMYQYSRRILEMLTTGKVINCLVKLGADEISMFYNGTNFMKPIHIENEYISGKFMVLKLRQKQGNIFELTALQKFD